MHAGGRAFANAFELYHMQVQAADIKDLLEWFKDSLGLGV